MSDDFKFIVFIKKYCYIVLPVVVTILYFFLDYFNIFTYFNNTIVKNINDNVTTMIGISGTLIGFLFTAMTILFSLNKDSKYMQHFKMYGHSKIFSRLIILGILFGFLI